MDKLEKKKEAEHAKLKKLEEQLMKVAENIPEKCKSVRLQHCHALYASDCTLELELVECIDRM